MADFEVALEPGAPHEVKDHSLAHLTSQWDESDVLLGSTLDLYQIHSATLDSGVLGDEKVLAKLQELKESRGLKIGLSLSGVLQAKTLDVAVQTGLFDSVQATYNLMESSVGSALERAHLEHGFDVIVKEGMANGRVLRNPKLLAAAKKVWFGCQRTTHRLLLPRCILATYHPKPTTNSIARGTARRAGAGLGNCRAIQPGGAVWRGDAGADRIELQSRGARGCPSRKPRAPCRHPGRV